MEIEQETQLSPQGVDENGQPLQPEGRSGQRPPVPVTTQQTDS